MLPTTRTRVTDPSVRLIGKNRPLAAGFFMRVFCVSHTLTARAAVAGYHRVFGRRAWFRIAIAPMDETPPRAVPNE
jgi:hypothetical protein